MVLVVFRVVHKAGALRSNNQIMVSGMRHTQKRAHNISLCISLSQDLLTNNLLNGDGIGVSTSSSSGSSACRVPFSPLLLIVLAVLIKVKAKGYHQLCTLLSLYLSSFMLF